MSENNSSAVEEKKECKLETPVKNRPPKLFWRNRFGLLDDIEYLYKEDGYVDYKRMVPKEFLYLNPERKANIEKKYGKLINEINISDVDDRDLVITLGGIKYLLKIRGYKNISYTIKESNENYVSISCIIEFLDNYETGYNNITFSDNACAHQYNTNSFGKKYLVEIATNRAFCRTIRNFLGINIVSQDELGGNTEDNVKNDNSDNLLQKIMNENNITFEKVKNRLIQENYVNANLKIEAKDISSINQIDMTKQFYLITKIKENLNKSS